MAESFFRNATRDDGETEVTVEIEVITWGSPAQTYGPPESCDPGEGMEVEIIDCWLLADDHKKDAPRVELTEAERDRIELEFLENPPEADDGPDYD